ncbi:hypothetical protein GXP67_18365 [Rhodocytophaga rosea]|uniref:Uncharacterized protein n=1 Tax=Rhodocytophaga rosea TaxID=2704465 RepID=A0A6C0GKA4_9BACT|nr:hypothetical protein [Rhodocytophaga rosea]QHT68466.1 hypothetical protein GXP67_18365 [Rhodocytophaga rosea]
MGIRLNKRTFVRWKIYIDRARMYIGYIQFFMIGIVFFESFKDKTLGKLVYDYIYISIPILFILFIFCSLVLGYFDSRLGFKEEEQRNISKSNPVLMEILQSVKRLEKEVKELKEQNKEKIN